MRYYVNENQRPVGPFTLEKLLARGIDGDTIVWGEGTEDWVLAKEIPELATALGLAPEAAVTEATAVSEATEDATPSVDPDDFIDRDLEGDDYDAQAANAAIAEAATKQAQPVAPAQPITPAEPQVESATVLTGTAAMAMGSQMEAIQQVRASMSQQAQPPQFPQQPQYQQPQSQYQSPQAPAKAPYCSKVQSILSLVLSFVCCCNFISAILAIMALVKGNSSLQAFKYGDFATADAEAAQANKYSLWSIIGQVVYPILILVITIILDPEANKAFMEIFE